MTAVRSYTPEHLPVAVYGTLRPGGGNYEWCAAPHRPIVHSGVVEGFALVDGPGFPYAVPVADQTIVVDVLSFSIETWADAAHDLDQLEGYPHHYDRVRVFVEPGEHDGTEAWLYTPRNAARVIERFGFVLSGDWFNR